MVISINDEDTCQCGAYWQSSGYCCNGHPRACKDDKMHEWQPTDTQGYNVQCIRCGTEVCFTPEVRKDDANI